MWEKDEQMLVAFRTCFQNMKASADSGEEIDWASTCKQETEALTKYTLKAVNTYQGSTAQLAYRPALAVPKP